MALIETNFIRPQEVYDRNTGESKVRYRSYDGNDRFIPVVEGENGVPKTLVEVTHAELKAMRDAGKLTPGALYRITDYNCTTTQENTQSAGHQFDIVLLALSENKLAEEGWAMMHESNIYDVTFSDGTKKVYLYYNDGDDSYNMVDIETLLGAVVDETDISVNEETKTAQIDSAMFEFDTPDLPYNYFQNSNLSAWKLWYCLDNDKSRFAWASPVDGLEDSSGNGECVRTASHDTNNLYAWYCEGENYYIYTKSPKPQIGDAVYDENGDATGETVLYYTRHEGTGVIYRLIDEFNNDIKYDFKNIQFKRKITDGQYDANGTETWCYTLNIWYNDMCQDASIVGNTLPNDEGYINGVHDNKFGYATDYDLFIQGVGTLAFALGNNVVLSFDDDGYFGIYSNTIGNNSYSNTIGNSFYSNTIGNSFFSNTIRNSFDSNTIGNSFHNKTISDSTSGKNYGNNGVELATKE